jgi:hypothetical protein
MVTLYFAEGVLTGMTGTVSIVRCQLSVVSSQQVRGGWSLSEN